MTVSVHGVVARGKGEPVVVTEVLVPDPGPGEALVRVQACGVCHTDLHYKMGGIGDDFPYLLGHEASGIVEAVGDDVTEVAPTTSDSQSLFTPFFAPDEIDGKNGGAGPGKPAAACSGRAHRYRERQGNLPHAAFGFGRRCARERRGSIGTIQLVRYSVYREITS